LAKVVREVERPVGALGQGGRLARGEACFEGVRSVAELQRADGSVRYSL